jgi:multisubunit Na+/H+ antiporter MnhB subunit
MKKPTGYSVLKQLAIFVCAVGMILLLSHVAGQLREGFASRSTSIGGAGCLGIGLLFAVLADLGTLLHRLEQRVGEAEQRPLVEREDGPHVDAPRDDTNEE